MSVAKGMVVSSSRDESPKEIASLSSEAAGLLQSFITSFAGSVSHKSLPSARYRLAPILSILPAFSPPDLNWNLLDDNNRIRAFQTI